MRTLNLAKLNTSNRMGPFGKLRMIRDYVILEFLVLSVPLSTRRLHLRMTCQWPGKARVHLAVRKSPVVCVNI